MRIGFIFDTRTGFEKHLTLADREIDRDPTFGEIIAASRLTAEVAAELKTLEAAVIARSIEAPELLKKLQASVLS